MSFLVLFLTFCHFLRVRPAWRLCPAQSRQPNEKQPAVSGEFLLKQKNFASLLITQFFTPVYQYEQLMFSGRRTNSCIIVVTVRLIFPPAGTSHLQGQPLYSGREVGPARRSDSRRTGTSRCLAAWEPERDRPREGGTQEEGGVVPEEQQHVTGMWPADEIRIKCIWFCFLVSQCYHVLFLSNSLPDLDRGKSKRYRHSLHPLIWFIHQVNSFEVFLFCTLSTVHQNTV